MSALQLRQRLDKACAEALATTWEHAQPVSIKLDPPPKLVDDALLAGAAYIVQARGGEWVEVHREPVAKMTTEDEVDDFLARGLSILLMKHPTWPK